MDFVRQVFPDVPQVFLYRDPAEVISSVLNGGVWWMFLKKSYPKVAETVTGIETSLVRSLSSEEYAARVIGHFYSNVLQQADKKVLLINYNRISEESCLRHIVSFFKLKISDQQITCMLKALQFYSKDLTRQKRHWAHVDTQNQPSRRVRNMAEKWAKAPYEGLEALAEKGWQGL
jgi:hypothetical protein